MLRIARDPGRRNFCSFVQNSKHIHLCVFVWFYSVWTAVNLAEVGRLTCSLHSLKVDLRSQAVCRAMLVALFPFSCHGHENTGDIHIREVNLCKKDQQGVSGSRCLLQPRAFVIMSLLMHLDCILLWTQFKAFLALSTSFARWSNFFNIFWTFWTC